MSEELKILELADYKELIEYEDCSCYLIVNKKIDKYNCMFGFVKLSENFENVKNLFLKAESRAQELGYTSIIGPLNYTTWMSYRWAISKFDHKYFPDCNNEPFYVDYVKQLGYKELYTYRSAHVKIDNKLYMMGELIYKQKLQEGFEFKLFKGKEVFDVTDDIYKVSIDAFKKAYLYSEIPLEYFNDVYLQWLRKIEDLFAYVAYMDGKPVGYILGYVNPYNKNEFIAKTSAVIEEYQKHKVFAAVLYLGYKYVKDLGYDEMVYHFQCEQSSFFEKFDDIESDEKRYAIFIKEL